MKLFFILAVFFFSFFFKPAFSNDHDPHHDYEEGSDKEKDEQKKKNVEKTKKPVKSSTKSSKTKVDKFNKSNYTFNEKGIGDFKKGDMVLWNRKVSEIESIKGKKAQICTIIKGERVCKLVLLSSLCLAIAK